MYELPTRAKLERMRALKEEGRRHFAAGDCAAACAAFRRALRVHDYTFPDDDADADGAGAAAEADGLRVDCLLNAAACGVRMGAWAAVVADATEVLTLAPGSAKAHFRRAVAHRHRGALDAAAADLDAAEAAGSDAPAVDAERRAVRRDTAAAAVARRALARAMFGPARQS